MKTVNNLNQRRTENKGKKLFCIITGVVIIGGMTYVIVKQQGSIKNLKGDIENMQKQLDKNETDIKLLKGVLHGNVIHSLRESYKRKLRYHEGRLINGIVYNNVLSSKDIKLRKEEIEFLSKQLENLDATEALLDP